MKTPIPPDVRAVLVRELAAALAAAWRAQHSAVPDQDVIDHELVDAERAAALRAMADQVITDLDDAPESASR